MATKKKTATGTNRINGVAGKDGGATAAVPVTIAPPNLQIGRFTIVGTAPLVQNKFSAKAREEMKAKQEAGSTAKSKKARAAKDFTAAYEAAIHRDAKGWAGFAAPSIRNAMISACRLVGYTMTRAKLSVFVLPDGFDADDGTPLVKITKGKPEYFESTVRNASGVCDIRPRPMWAPGWEAVVNLRYDGDQFTVDDVSNLLMRAGLQVGIGEGRPDSKNSAGMGWGTFEIASR